jgi:ABC-type branched-subunit amino acid transport system substrate-binding protein
MAVGTAVSAAGLFAFSALTGLVGVSTATPSAAASSPIVVGGVGSLTFSGGPSPYADQQVGAAAAFAAQNRAGGIDGRKIDFVGVMDDGGSVATQVTDINNLIDNKHVVMVDPINTGAQISPTVMAQNKVPFVGYSVWPAFCTPYGFGFDGCLTSTKETFLTDVAMAKTLLGGNVKGKTFATIFANQYEIGATDHKVSAKAVGFDVCYAAAPIPYTTITDYTPYVDDILSACGSKGPDVLNAGPAISTQWVGLIAALRARGWKGLALNAVFDEDLVHEASAQPAVQNSIFTIVGYGLPADNVQAPIFKTIKQQEAKIGQASTGITSGVLYGYISAEQGIAMMKEAAKKYGVANVTGANIAAAANAGWTYPGIPGLDGATKWPSDHTNLTACGEAIKVHNERLLLAVPFKCYGTVKVS